MYSATPLKLLVGFSLLMLTYGWDSDELEIFDVVEEVNENFYTLMGITQEATTADVKKSYRTLSKQIHPDKNDAPDAEIKFRQLVAVYEILRDENRRARYDRVLIEGLPDWRSPIYYYRRARKMSLIELSIILTVVISITQYLMAWGSYLDKKHTMEEYLFKKYKIKDRRKRKPEDLETLNLLESELNSIPRPRWWNILPVQLVQLTIFLVTNGPSLVRSFVAAVKEDRLRREEEKRKMEEEERRLKEEEERKREKRAQMKSRKKVNNLPDYTGMSNLDPANELLGEKNLNPVKPVTQVEPIITGGLWTEDDFSELSKLMAKYPGGTFDRWEKIAALMDRTVFEVTKMSSRVKAELMNRSLIPDSLDSLPEKVKQKTKGGKTGNDPEDKVNISQGSDEFWSDVQQKALEKSLKQFPKGTDQRWDKIARFVPEKTKEDCMIRFKYLAEKIRKKKEEQKNEDIQEEQGGNEVLKYNEDNSFQEEKVSNSGIDIGKDNVCIIQAHNPPIESRESLA